MDRAGDAGALRVDAEADVLTLNGEDKNGPYAIYAALVLPDDTSVELSAESTAIQAIFVGLGYMASQPVTRWSLIRSEIAATPEVGEFATVLAERLDRNPRAFAAFEDGRLLDAYGAALAAAAERVATTLQSTTGLAPAVPDFKPAQEQEGVRLEPIEPADIDLQNDTKLYMSARVVAADGTEIRPHIRHPWDSNIIGPQGWGLLFIASSTNVPVAGRDSTFEIITAGARGNSADGYVRSYLVGRLVLDGVVLPLFNEFMLKKLLGQKLRSQDAASILIDLIGPDKWNGVIQSIISNPNGMMRTVKKRIFDVIVDQFLASCLQLPPGDACQAFAKVVARGLGWLTPEAVLKKLSAQVAKQIAVYITPYLGQIKAAWEGLGAVNTFGSVVLSATDMLSTSGQINFELDYPLDIQSVQPACLAPDPDGKPVKLYVNGRGFNPVPQGSLFWKKTVKPEVSLGRADGDPVYIRPDGSAMTVEFATGDLSDGEYHLVVRHQNQTVESDAVIQVAADSIQATGLEPAKGAAGTRVRIYGCGFSTRLGDHTVTFAGKDGRVNAPVLAATPAFLVVSVPKDAVSGDVIVTVGDRTSEPLPFEVEEANVTITYGDCGAANDDTFALYVDGAVVSSMPAPSRPFPVAVNVSTGAHTVSLLGITAPDDVGTYCIEFSGNVTVRSGPSLSGDDLTAGVRKTWQIDVGAGTGSAKPGPASIRGQTKPGLDG
ncbi:MAG: hypothetical protein D6761_10140 [Candidatus Dadabacteria bacterium]|nr:MAG: hypothetical protein D6761_10140 [Candidatus Dadabacteria bacterium]